MILSVLYSLYSSFPYACLYYNRLPTCILLTINYNYYNIEENNKSI